MLKLLRPFSVVIAMTVSMGAASFDVAKADETVQPSSLESMMLYRSYIQDDPTCVVNVDVENGATLGPGLNPATCPDAFAWIQFVNAINDSFWNWGTDQSTWPQEPLPLCQDGATTDCCNPAIAYSDQPQNCPIYRADAGDNALPLLNPAVSIGTPSHNVFDHSTLNIVDKLDPGRLLRDLELELVFRNKPMVDYIFREDLYSTQGLAARFRAQSADLNDGNVGAAHQLQVEFPIESVMVKADFIHECVMRATGLVGGDEQTEALIGESFEMDQCQALSTPEGTAPPNNPEFPYITVYLNGSGSAADRSGYYYMTSMTNASKALPIWHWYAIDHAALPGRCDFTGCNDSFGYAANPNTGGGATFASNFIPPKMTANNDVAENGDALFVTGEVYDQAFTGEEPTEALKALFAGMGIGTGTDGEETDFTTFSPADPAWHSYRLKGTQVDFNLPTGIPTGAGSVITEGGFVNSSSCLTCHSQAASDAEGTTTIAGVGSSWRPNLYGYAQVEMGAPNPAWFYGNGALSNGGPGVIATQIDFVWGILNAQCQKGTASEGSSTCTTYYDVPKTSSDASQ